MNVSYLYSGADVSGRDQLLSRGSGQKLEGIIARAVTAVAFTVATFSIAPTGQQVHLPASTSAVQLEDLRDPLLESVWKVRSDRIQPNDKARRRAAVVLDELRGSGIEPDRVVADPDGGIALYVFGNQSLGAGGGQARHARILAANEGDVIALCVDYRHDSHDAWQAEIHELGPTVAKVQSFIAG